MDCGQQMHVPKLAVTPPNMQLHTQVGCSDGPNMTKISCDGWKCALLCRRECVIPAMSCMLSWLWACPLSHASCKPVVRCSRSQRRQCAAAIPAQAMCLACSLLDINKNIVASFVALASRRRGGVHLQSQQKPSPSCAWGRRLRPDQCHGHATEHCTSSAKHAWLTIQDTLS